MGRFSSLNPHSLQSHFCRAARSGWLFGLMVLAIFLAACVPPSPAPTTGPDVNPSQAPLALTETAAPALTLTPTIEPTPTATPVPLAAQVNQGGVTLAEYQSELQRYRAAETLLQRTPAAEADAKTAVLDDLINQELLAQAAVEGGFVLNEADLQARVDQVIAERGGQEAFNTWLAANFYTPDTFRVALARQMAAAWQRDQISASIPAEMEQIHARQILIYHEDDAKIIYDQLKAGADFATLAQRYDPVSLGELGWFPQGYLLSSEVEAAVFALQPEQMTEIVKSPAGYHMVKILERGMHPLSPDARQVLQQKALKAWIEHRRAQSTIAITVP